MILGKRNSKKIYFSQMKEDILLFYYYSQSDAGVESPAPHRRVSMLCCIFIVFMLTLEGKTDSPWS